MDPKVHEAVLDYLSTVCATLTGYVNACESPIEQLFLIALEKIAYKERLGSRDFVWASQYHIPSTKFRVDFILMAMDGEFTKCAAVECDGHDFHEKTKAQAAYDKQRDRFFTRKGLPVFHYTGSEIWNDAYRCAREVFDYLYDRIHEAQGTHAAAEEMHR